MLLNPFETDAFNLVTLTNSINKMDVTYGRLRELGIFRDRGVTTRTIVVEEQNGVSTLLPTMPVGSPGTQNKMGKRRVRSFTIPHIPLEDVIQPDEFSAVRGFGTDVSVATLEGVINAHLAAAKRKFANTLEYLRMGALKGAILDADGSVIYNLFTEFGVTPKIVNFDLDDDETNVREKCLEVVRHIEDNLQGEIMTEVHALVSEEFFNALVKHPSVLDVFKYTNLSVGVNGGDIRKSFAFGGIVFEEYRGAVSGVDGVSRRLIESGKGHAFPNGTMDTFESIYAPADFVETANTVGLPLYAKQVMKKFDRGIDLHVQSNPLPICYRPGVLVTLEA